MDDHHFSCITKLGDCFFLKIAQGPLLPPHPTAHAQSANPRPKQIIKFKVVLVWYQLLNILAWSLNLRNLIINLILIFIFYDHKCIIFKQGF
jgi:hypothetical protein